MEFHTIVRSEHINGFNRLFGGQMLQWVDDFAYIAAVSEFPLTRFVTKGMDKVEFSRGVKNGALLRFDVRRKRLGITSVSYEVEVWSRDAGCANEHQVFSTTVTMVAVSEDGHKIAITGTPSDAQIAPQDAPTVC